MMIRNGVVPYDVAELVVREEIVNRGMAETNRTSTCFKGCLKRCIS